MLRSRSQIRDALLLAMASAHAVDSFGPLSGGGGGGRLGAARGLLGNLDPSENQVTAATASSDETKRVLPVWGFRAETAQLSSTRKRSYRRACRRAVLTGKALYRGKWLTLAQLGVAAHTASPAPTMPKQSLSQCKLGQPTRAGRFRCLSWNSGSGNVCLLDELESYGISENIDVLCIQETRMSIESQWSTASYHYIHTGKERSNQQVCGVLVMISTKMAKAHQIRCASLVRGHLLHVRVQMKTNSLDILGLYQHTWHSRETRQHDREKLLGDFQGALHALPRRNLLLVCGDFNTDFVPDPPVVGYSPIRRDSASEDDTYLLQDILKNHDLCAISTWAGRREYTCVAHSAKCMIDAILLRRMHADPQSRNTRPLRDCPLGMGSEGSSYHLPLVASISKFWRCWSTTSRSSTTSTSSSTFSTSPTSPSSTCMSSSISPSLIDVEQMTAESKLGTSKWHHLVQSISTLSFSPGQVNGQLLRLLHAVYPKQAARSNSPGLSPSIFAKKWRIARALRSPAGAGIHSILIRWKLVAQLQVLHRQCFKISRQRRRDRLAQIIQDARSAAHQHDAHALFRVIRRLSPKRPRIRVQLTSASGLAMSPKEEHTLIMEHFRNLFVRDGARGWEVPYCRRNPVTEAELILSFARLKTHKALPRHYAPAQVWKLLGRHLAPKLSTYLDQSWTDTRPVIPTEWTTSWIVLVPKPNKKKLTPADLRPISLQDPVGKVCLQAVVHNARDRCFSLLVSWPLYAYIPMGYLGCNYKSLCACHKGTEKNERISKHSLHNTCWIGYIRVLGCITSSGGLEIGF